MTDLEIVWLAGLLEGEGSFMKGPPSSPNLPIISVQMTDEDVIAKVANMFGNKYYKTTWKKEIRFKDCYSARLKGQKAIKMMILLLPYMSIRRTQQITEAINSYNPAVRKGLPPKLTLQQVEEIKNYRLQGFSVRKLGDMYGLHHTNIARCLKRAMLKFGAPTED